MKPKKLSYFDVRRNVDTKGARSANLMCFLLRGLDYNQLYAKPFSRDKDTGEFDTLKKLVENSTELPDDLCIDADGGDCNLRPIFGDGSGSGVFERLIDAMKNYGGPDIILGDLFWKPRDDSDTASEYSKMCNTVVDLLDGVHSGHGNKLSHFCCPFVGIQKKRAVLLEKFHIRDFLFHFGGRNIEYFYSVPGSPTEKKAIRRAKELGILSETRAAIASSEVGSGNGMICDNGVCVPSPDENHFCSMVVNPNPPPTMICSLYSDHK